MCVGRLTAHKRTELILELMPSLLERFPDLELHIVGEGVCRPELERTAARLGVNRSVTFHGSLPGPARDELLASAWMSVKASVAEGWCLSVVEANALGVPVLAIRRPGLRDSIRDGETGWLVDDEAALTDATIRALEALTDLRTAEDWSRRARRWAAGFSWERMADRILRTLDLEYVRLTDPDTRTPISLPTLPDLPEHVVLRPTARIAPGHHALGPPVEADDSSGPIRDDALTPTGVA